MPSGIRLLENEGEKQLNQTQPEIVQRATDRQPIEPPETAGPMIYRLQSSTKNIEEKNSKRGMKRGHYSRELWPDNDNSRMRKKIKIKYEQDDQAQPQNEQPKQAPKQMPNTMKSRRTGCRRSRRSRRRASSRSGRRSNMCRKTYYRKRRYCCPGKRRYKASKRCCPSKYNKNRINICNRNWARISIYPFINFLRVFRRKFCKGTPPNEIVKKGKIEWKKMTCNNKKKFYEQAKRARIRGYRT